MDRRVEIGIVRMESKLYTFLFWLGVIWASLCIMGFILSSGYHLWLDFSMIGVVLFLCSIICEQKLFIEKYCFPNEK